jgi:DNA-3-methyladenine glycosylase
VAGTLRNHHPNRGRRQETLWSGQPFDFVGPTIDVAQRLVGAFLIRRIPRGKPDAGTQLVARIVETEAYLPLVDPACHGYRGPTRRNASIFGRPGTSYVYFIYGNHFCLNVVSEPPGIGAAVLIRAAEPIEGLEAMRRRRPGVPDDALACGPGNLTRAMGIDGGDDGAELHGGLLRIVAPTRSPGAPIASPRIGISVAREWPLRFLDPTSASVSPYRRGRVKSGVHLVDGAERSVV